jgi:hypothetical protein
LAKLTENSKRPIKLPAIKDPRQVKGPMAAFIFFSKERYASGDLKHMKVGEAGQRIAQEWSGLTESEKQVSEKSTTFRLIKANSEIQKYIQLQEEDRERYVSEYQSVYGEEPSIVKRASSES